MRDGDVPTNNWGWEFIQYVVFDSLVIAFGMGIFSTKEMVFGRFSITNRSHGVNLFNASKYGYGISYFNYGLSRGWVMVCVG